MALIHDLLVTLLLAVVILLAAAVAARPAMRPDKPGLLATACLIAALALGRGGLWAAPGWMFLAPGAAAAFMLTFVVIARAFRQVDMMAIFLHADFGMKGATLKGLENEIIAAIASLALVLLPTYLIRNLWDFGPWFYGLVAAVLLALNPLVQYVVRRQFLPPIAGDIAEHLVPPGPMQVPDTLPDLIVIYLEGTDRRFFDTAVFGNAAAPLAELEAEGLTFTNVAQIAGTGWSLAGMVATQLGVPLLPRGLLTRNNLKIVDRFMPTLTALGDVLGEQGYAMEYVVGGDQRFGGIEAFYRTHGITRQIGLAEQSALYPADEVAAAMIDWILDDQMTFASARLRHEALVTGATPYLMVIETIGPHGRLGYLSRRASPTGRGIKSPDTKAVVRCTVEEAAWFVRDARAAHAAAGRGRPLLFALLSDHLSHNRTAPPGAAEFKGRNTVIFLGQGAGQNGRQGAMIDIYPTLLHWMGFAQGPVAAGLGRSLLAEPPTLVETYGTRQIDAMLTSNATLAARVWAAG